MDAGRIIHYNVASHLFYIKMLYKLTWLRNLSEQYWL